MRNNAPKKLPFAIRHVPDQYNTQQMCDQTILQNYGTLESALGCGKNHEISDKTVTLTFVLDCYMTIWLCDKAANF